MTRPICRCLPSFTCACDRCAVCHDVLTDLEVEKSLSEHGYGGKLYYEKLKCNPCRLEAEGYCVLPDGTYALTPEVLADLNASDPEP